MRIIVDVDSLSIEAIGTMLQKLASHSLFSGIKFHDKAMGCAATAIAGFRQSYPFHTFFFDDKTLEIPNTVRRRIRHSAPLANIISVATTGENFEESLGVAVEEAQKSGCEIAALISLSSNRTFVSDAESRCFGALAVGAAFLIMPFPLAQRACGRAMAGNFAETISPSKIITPGIRWGNERTDDQKHTATPLEAFELGLDHIVVGRPIVEHPAFLSDPAEAFNSFLTSPGARG